MIENYAEMILDMLGRGGYLVEDADEEMLVEFVQEILDRGK